MPAVAGTLSGGDRRDRRPGISIPELTSGQYGTVDNLFSLAIASLFFTGLYLVLSQRRVLPRYRNALVVNATVCFIATYHYVRIFDNFKESYVTDAQGGQGTYALTNIAFNEGYRYVDWFLTVPLLLVVPVALWLCAADRLALADGVWAVSSASSTAVLLLGLPLEEALFFLLTTLLVADGLVLATDRLARARAVALLPRRRTVHAWTTRS